MRGHTGRHRHIDCLGHRHQFDSGGRGPCEGVGKSFNYDTHIASGELRIETRRKTVESNNFRLSYPVYSEDVFLVGLLRVLSPATIHWTVLQSVQFSVSSTMRRKGAAALPSNQYGQLLSTVVGPQSGEYGRHLESGQRWIWLSGTASTIVEPTRSLEFGAECVHQQCEIDWRSKVYTRKRTVTGKWKIIL